MQQDKINAIREYLQQQFPESKIDDTDDFDRCGHKFRALEQKNVLLASVSDEVAMDNSKESLVSILKSYGLPNLMREHPGSIVLIASNNVHILPIK